MSNIEKIDSSRGRSFNSLEGALGKARDNAVIVIAPPGSGKTVSLRNLAIKKAKQRLSKKTSLVPIFVQLAYYTDFASDGRIEDFPTFLESYFSNLGYQRFLSARHWERLLRQPHCIFFLDGLDEIPRRPTEYENRCRAIADFVRAWPNTSFILSCRELDYNRELSFQQILIKPFDRGAYTPIYEKILQYDRLQTSFSPTCFLLWRIRAVHIHKYSTNNIFNSHPVSFVRLYIYLLYISVALNENFYSKDWSRYLEGISTIITLQSQLRSHMNSQ